MSQQSKKFTVQGRRGQTFFVLITSRPRNCLYKKCSAFFLVKLAFSVIKSGVQQRLLSHASVALQFRFPFRDRCRFQHVILAPICEHKRTSFPGRKTVKINVSSHLAMEQEYVLFGLAFFLITLGLGIVIYLGYLKCRQRQAGVGLEALLVQQQHQQQPGNLQQQSTFRDRRRG